MKAHGAPRPPTSSETVPYREAFESALHFIAVLDTQGRVLDVNRAALSFVGTPKEAVRGRYLGDTPWWRLADDGARTRLREAVKDAADGSCVCYEVLAAGQGDKTAIVDFSLRPLYDGVGRVTHLLAESQCHDVNTRTDAERRLRESEERFRLISENVDDLIAILDTEGRRIYSSPSYSRLLRDEGSHCRRDCFERVHPDDRERIRQLFHSVIQSAKGQRAEYRYLMPDGQYRFVESQSSVIRDAQGQVCNVLLVARDVTERKQAEAEIRSLNQLLERRIEERTQEFVEANRKLIAEIAERRRAEDLLRDRTEQMRRHREVLLELAQSRDEDFASALERILRVTATTLGVARASYWEFTPGQQALVCRQMYCSGLAGLDRAETGAILDGSRFPEYFQALHSKRRVVADDAAASLARDYLRAHGTAAVLDMPVWFQGEMVGVVRHDHANGIRPWNSEEIGFAASIGTQVSLALESWQRAQAEADLKALQSDLELTLREREAILENSWVGIAFLKERRFVWANRALGELQGYDREELIGTSTEPHFASTEIYQQFGAEAYPALATGLNYSTVRLMRRRDGAVYWAKMHGRAVDPSDLGKGAIWTVDDVTDRVRAEQEIRKALEKEKELNELKSRFVSMTSHEFRTPLGTILSSAELLECYGDRLPPDQQGELLASIKNSVKRMVGMLDDVLLIGRADAGRIEFQPRELHLEQFCRGLVEEIGIFAGDRIEYASRGHSRHPRLFDEKLLRHILGNLLSNAIKYSPENTAVHFTSEYGENATILRVADQGIGIPEEDLPYLFETFHRAKNVGNISGTGLGLSIVKRAVELHGGSIVVDSVAGEGTTFTVYLPFDIDGVQA